MAMDPAVFKCELCKHLVEVVHEGKGEVVCCGAPMKLVVENTVDASKEKHVPVSEKTSDSFKVKGGSVDLPVEEKYSIEWIGLPADGRAYRPFLNPGDALGAVFCITASRVAAECVFPLGLPAQAHDDTI